MLVKIFLVIPIGLVLLGIVLAAWLFGCDEEESKYISFVCPDLEDDP